MRQYSVQGPGLETSVPYPGPFSAQSLDNSAYREKPRTLGEQGIEYVHGVQGGSPEPASAAEGVAHRPQKHLANGGAGEGTVPFPPPELPPQSHRSPRVGGVGAEREENGGFRWILVEEDSGGPWQRGVAFSHL